MTTILAPIDFSPVAKAVVGEAVRLARAERAKLVLMHVVEPPAAVVDYGLVTLNVPEITAASGQFAERRLAGWKKKAQARGLRVETVVATGFPVAEIARQARALKARCIVVGSHGHAAFYELLIGSTASGVLKKAGCPVMIVPAQRNRR